MTIFCDRNYVSETSNRIDSIECLLTIADVSEHFRLRPATVRKYVRDGQVSGHLVGREYRFSWANVWAIEDGPQPRGTQQQERYKLPLITKTDIAASMAISLRTVDRWIASGMPTRNVGNNVRLNPRDSQHWLKSEFGLLAPLYPYLTDETI
ncbi:helix-turn-helix domain-containing protein [Oceaniovalibus sp. ACAM 378]|uniref:helix-turn-helix domain-containing protein n=1 Tax=Oceaniovalibus sp. ACAM 378 TaxID=2599923 RepID=UPI0011D7411C|nr:helix-turn-helix domain-containing protein [Oceaniovalibus sp. ACAM 378]TYB85214.1 helix-turn-helix domain-containing protein [Oceaniovalibus sp. ACAM 378]